MGRIHPGSRRKVARARGRILGIRRGRVRYIAVASRRLMARRRVLRRYLRAAR